MSDHVTQGPHVDATSDADPTGDAGAAHGHRHAPTPHLPEPDRVTVAGTPRSDGTGPRIVLPDAVAENYRELVASEPAMTWEDLAVRMEQADQPKVAEWARQQSKEQAAKTREQTAASDAGPKETVAKRPPAGRSHRPTAKA